MSISQRKLRANRANAQKSTGPTSAAGKQHSACNGIQHGLTGRFHVLANECQAEFDSLVSGLLASEQPVGQAERELVVKMARHTWLSARAQNFQEACFLLQTQTGEQIAASEQTVAVRKDLEIYLRYQTHHDRAYQRAAAELLKRKKDRDLAARGFASQNRASLAQKQRDELHRFKVATAQCRAQREMERTLNSNPCAEVPKPSVLPGETVKIAA